MATGGGGNCSSTSLKTFDRRFSEAATSAEGIKSLNSELREHLSRLRSQLELTRSGGKNDHWQKVLDARAIREEEQQKTVQALQDQRVRLERERTRELAGLRESLLTRYQNELLKLQRHKEAENTKLRLDVQAKEDLIRRLIREARRMSLKSSQTDEALKTRLLHELSEVRSSKKELEDRLEAADTAQRNHSDQLRKQEETLQAEVAKVRRDSQLDIRQLSEAQDATDYALSVISDLRIDACVFVPVSDDLNCTDLVLKAQSTVVSLGL